MASERELAESLIRMHGKGAEKVAAQFADVFKKSGDVAMYGKWLRISQLVSAILLRG